MKTYIDHPKRLGYPGNEVHEQVLHAFYNAIRLNLNSYGMHMQRGLESVNKGYTHRIKEIETINFIKNWINFRQFDNCLGYVNSGSTEGLIWAHWAAKKYSDKLDLKPIALFGRHAHPSVRKAISVTGIDSELIDGCITGDDITTHLGILKENVLPIINLNWINPIVAEYDDLAGSLKVLRRVSPNAIVIVDGAFGGIINRICHNSDLSNLDVDAFVMDFHKGGMAPIGVGVVLYNPVLQENIAINSDYLPYGEDTTLLGSRNYANVMALQECINLIKSGWLNDRYTKLRRFGDKLKGTGKVVKDYFPVFILEGKCWPLAPKILRKFEEFDIFPTRISGFTRIRVILNPSTTDEAIEELIQVISGI